MYIMIMFSEIKEIWQDIEDLLEEKAPHIKACLNPGISIEEVELLEEYLGFTLPLDFKFSLLIHNGSNGEEQFYYYDDLLGVEQIREYWDMHKSIFEGEEAIPIFEDDNPYQMLRANWDRKWIYITMACFGGDGLVLDMNPEINGIPGQIFYRRNVHERVNVCCRSFYEFLTIYRDQLKEDRWDPDSESFDHLISFVHFRQLSNEELKS